MGNQQRRQARLSPPPAGGIEFEDAVKGLVGLPVDAVLGLAQKFRAIAQSYRLTRDEFVRIFGSVDAFEALESDNYVEAVHVLGPVALAAQSEDALALLFEALDVADSLTLQQVVEGVAKWCRHPAPPREALARFIDAQPPLRGPQDLKLDSWARAWLGAIARDVVEPTAPVTVRHALRGEAKPPRRPGASLTKCGEGYAYYCDGELFFVSRARAAFECVAAPTSEKVPLPRNFHAACALEDSGVFVFGGALVANGSLLNDAWVLERTLRWRELAPAGTPPSPRRGAVAAAVGGTHVCVFGSDRGLADVHLLRLEEDQVRWETVSTADGVCPPRCNLLLSPPDDAAAAATYKKKRLLLLGAPEPYALDILETTTGFVTRWHNCVIPGWPPPPCCSLCYSVCQSGKNSVLAFREGDDVYWELAAAAGEWGFSWVRHSLPVPLPSSLVLKFGEDLYALRGAKIRLNELVEMPAFAAPTRSQEETTHNEQRPLPQGPPPPPIEAFDRAAERTHPGRLRWLLGHSGPAAYVAPGRVAYAAGSTVVIAEIRRVEEDGTSEGDRLGSFFPRASGHIETTQSYRSHRGARVTCLVASEGSIASGDAAGRVLFSDRPSLSIEERGCVSHLAVRQTQTLVVLDKRRVALYTRLEKDWSRTVNSFEVQAAAFVGEMACAVGTPSGGALFSPEGVETPLACRGSALASIAALRRDDWFVAGGDDGVVRAFWGRRVEASVRAHECGVVAMAAVDATLATGDAIGVVRLWSVSLEVDATVPPSRGHWQRRPEARPPTDVAVFRCDATFQPPWRAPVASVSLAGDAVLVATRDGSARLARWRLGGAEEATVISGPGRAIDAIDNQLATVGRSLKLWDASRLSRGPTREIPLHREGTAVAFSRQKGCRLAVGTADGAVLLATRFGLDGAIRETGDPVTALAWSLDSEKVAVATLTGLAVYAASRPPSSSSSSWTLAAETFAQRAATAIDWAADGHALRAFSQFLRVWTADLEELVVVPTSWATSTCEIRLPPHQEEADVAEEPALGLAATTTTKGAFCGPARLIMGDTGMMLVTPCDFDILAVLEPE
ncbi:hypothetical protein CTAYLR_008426 [Chrysophaeum taylorii]|uniref:Uncharacterized protein n=1 Tax=Chrysophaeum taylorii TaxID=2483200 RepID=A0AAD7XSB6_9STRA|nr:hypothetical protein CTAYLR_008426 [Chrysophaeum taylorii]